MKVLLATLYGPDPILYAANKIGPDKMVLIADKKLKKEQKETLELLEKSLGRVIKIEVLRAEVYDIVHVAKVAVDVIDKLGKGDDIYVNITSGRKTQAIGLLLGAYARSIFIKKIVYFPEEKGSVVSLPKLKFNLTESQKKVMEHLDKGKFKSVADLASKVKLSTAMVYRNLKELEEMDLVEDLKLTDAGKVARL